MEQLENKLDPSSNQNPVFFIDFSDINFICPHCQKPYIDDNDLYLNRCKKNKRWTTRVNCTCGKSFYMTYDYRGDAYSFL